MKNSFTKKQLGLAVACALALGLASGALRAQNLSPNTDRELWVEGRNMNYKSAYGECWRSMYGPPPGYGDCNPAPVAQYVPPPPPRVTPPPPPAPAPVIAPPPAPAPVVAPAPLPPRKTRG